MLRHEHTPLHLVQHWSELPAGTALFDHILVFENYPLDAARFGSHRELAVSDVVVSEVTNYPLALTVVPAAELALQMDYHDSRFGGAEIAALLTRFTGVLRAFAEAA